MTFAEAKEACCEGQQVVGFFRDGKPDYLVVDADLPDREVRDLVFATIHDRPMNGSEKVLARALETLDA